MASSLRRRGLPLCGITRGGGASSHLPPLPQCALCQLLPDQLLCSHIKGGGTITLLLCFLMRIWRTCWWEVLGSSCVIVWSEINPDGHLSYVCLLWRTLAVSQGEEDAATNTHQQEEPGKAAVLQPPPGGDREASAPLPVSLMNVYMEHMR